MFEERRAAAREKQMEMLSRKCEDMAAEIKRLTSEKLALEIELENCKARLTQSDEAYKTFTESAAEAREVRDKYLKAYDELQIIRRRYSAEVEKLITDMEKYSR